MGHAGVCEKSAYEPNFFGKYNQNEKCPSITVNFEEEKHLFLFQFYFSEDKGHITPLIIRPKAFRDVLCRNAFHLIFLRSS